MRVAKGFLGCCGRIIYDRLEVQLLVMVACVKLAADVVAFEGGDVVGEFRWGQWPVRQ